MKRSSLVIIFLLPLLLNAQVLHIYGGEDYEEYLGCLNCSKYDKNSIWNKYGTFGNSYNAKSIWNSYGTFGNEYNRYSPWNAYDNNPPIGVLSSGHTDSLSGVRLLVSIGFVVLGIWMVNSKKSNIKNEE